MALYLGGGATVGPWCSPRCELGFTRLTSLVKGQSVEAKQCSARLCRGGCLLQQLEPAFPWLALAHRSQVNVGDKVAKACGKEAAGL